MSRECLRQVIFPPSELLHLQDVQGKSTAIWTLQASADPKHKLKCSWEEKNENK